MPQLMEGQVSEGQPSPWSTLKASPDHGKQPHLLTPTILGALEGAHQQVQHLHSTLAVSCTEALINPCWFGWFWGFFRGFLQLLLPFRDCLFGFSTV